MLDCGTLAFPWADAALPAQGRAPRLQCLPAIVRLLLLVAWDVVLLPICTLPSVQCLVDDPKTPMNAFKNPLVFVNPWSYDIYDNTFVGQFPPPGEPSLRQRGRRYVAGWSNPHGVQLAFALSVLRS